MPASGDYACIRGEFDPTGDGLFRLADDQVQVATIAREMIRAVVIADPQYRSGMCAQRRVSHRTECARKQDAAAVSINLTATSNRAGNGRIVQGQQQRAIRE